MKQKKLCNQCILPENYSGISFNNGICNYCSNNKTRMYLGLDKLKENIKSILAKHNKNRNYDCVVGFSGGRDSTYLLWIIVKKLKLKPLVVFVDSGFIPERTIKNIHLTADILNIDLKIIRTNYLQKAFPIHFNAWFKKPTPETLITLCVGCRYGINRFVDEEAIKQKIPIVFTGTTPFEGNMYKTNLVKLNPKAKSKLIFILGYFKQILKNPFLVTNPYTLLLQVKEYYFVFFRRKMRLKKHNIHGISIFYSYIRWIEKEVMEILEKKLAWKNYPCLKTKYRTDCEIGILRQYLYWKLLGYNDKDDHFSDLIRDNQMSREEALERINAEHQIPNNVLKKICKKAGVNYSKIERIINYKVNTQLTLYSNSIS